MDKSIQGERFGKLVVIGPSSEIKYGSHTVLCRCDCGEMISVPPFRLWSGQYIVTEPLEHIEGSPVDEPLAEYAEHHCYDTVVRCERCGEV